MSHVTLTRDEARSFDDATLYGKSLQDLLLFQLIEERARSVALKRGAFVVEVRHPIGGRVIERLSFAHIERPACARCIDAVGVHAVDDSDARYCGRCAWDAGVFVEV